LRSETALGLRQHAYLNARLNFAQADLGERLESSLRALLD